MAGVTIRVEVRDAEVRARLARLADAPRRALAPIGMALVAGTQRRIREERTPEDAAFVRLTPAYRAVERGGGILRASGLLMGSLTFRAGADQVEVGTHLVRARVHQFGATIRPKRTKRLRFRPRPHARG